MLAALGMAVATFTGGVAAYAGGWLLFPAVLIFSYLPGCWPRSGSVSRWWACSGPFSW